MNADGKAKYLRLLEEKFGSHKYVKQYKEYLEFPLKVKTILYGVEKINVLKYEGQFADRIPGPGVHNAMSFSELGYYGKNGDMWFTGIQADARYPGSFLISNGKVEFFKGTFDQRPKKESGTEFEKEDYEHAKKASKAVFDGYLGALTKNMLNHILYDGNPVVEKVDNLFGPREYYSDKIILDYDVIRNRMSSIRIIPFSSGFRDFFGYATFHNNIDTRMNIYYELRETKDSTIKVLMVYNYPTRDYYLFTLGTMKEIDPGEKEMGYHFLVGEDDNLYYQIATDKAYHIFRITPQWDKVIKTQDYVSAIGEFYPKYKEAWDALSD